MQKAVWKLEFLCSCRHLVIKLLLGWKTCQQQAENEMLHLDQEEMLQEMSQLEINAWLGEVWLKK